MKITCIIICLFVSSFSNTTLAQDDPPCDYIPLEFNEVEPIWTHLVIDSTFIGHIDTSEGTGQFRQYYYNGMDQLRWDGGSFVHDGFLYSITEVFYDIDLSGYFIEKIDIETGESLWEIRTDLRHVDYREKALKFEIVDNQLVMYGVRPFRDEKDLLLFNLAVGFIPTYFFTRRYDIETGDLIYHYTPSDSDTLAMELKSQRITYYLFPLNDSIYEYFYLDVHYDRGYFMTRVLMDTLGHQVSSFDTVIVGNYNHLNFRESYFERNQQFLKDDSGHYYYLEQFLPSDTSDIERQTQITKYDIDFNPINSWDISSLNLETYSSFSISHVLDNKIILKGCLQENPALFCKLFLIVLDTDLNYLFSFQGKYKEEYLHVMFYRSEKFVENGQLIAIDRRLLEDEYSYLNAYVSNTSGTMDSVLRMTIKEFNWVGFAEKLFILDNGDILTKIVHSCYVDGRKNSAHPEWFRFRAEDFKLMTSISEEVITKDNEISISPNPASSIIQISFDTYISGWLAIYNNQGQLIFGSDLEHQNQIDMDIFDFNAGSYIIKVIDQDGQALTSKFVKL